MNFLFAHIHSSGVTYAIAEGNTEAEARVGMARDFKNSAEWECVCSGVNMQPSDSLPEGRIYFPMRGG